MSMFPHAVTIYTVVENQVTFEPDVNISVFRGALVDATKGAVINSTGMENADAVTVYIPFDTPALDPITGVAKTYLGPKEYERTGDKSGYWTIDTTNSFMVEGEVVVEDADFQSMNNRYDGVYRISTVDRRDFGSPDMQHWQIGGK